MWGTNSVDLLIEAVTLWVHSPDSLLIITTRMADHEVTALRVRSAQGDGTERMLELELEQAKGR